MTDDTKKIFYEIHLGKAWVYFGISMILSYLLSSHTEIGLAGFFQDVFTGMFGIAMSILGLYHTIASYKYKEKKK
jgi:hypothetical protein